MIKESKVSDEKDVIQVILYALSAFFGGWFLWDRKVLRDDHQKLERRVRDVEQSSVGEQRVRRMIEDVFLPLKETQSEMKGDIKQLLRLALERKKTK